MAIQRDWEEGGRKYRKKNTQRETNSTHAHTYTHAEKKRKKKKTRDIINI